MQPKIIAFDLDDVLCHRETKETGIGKYHACKPIPEMIKIVNECYDKGLIVKIFTARGMCTLNGNTSQIYSHLFTLTTDQLDRWGVKYHQLIMGKAQYDLLVDDKAVNSIKIKTYKDILTRI
jgi:hypothetical protein